MGSGGGGRVSVFGGGGGECMGCCSSPVYIESAGGMVSFRYIVHFGEFCAIADFLCR